VGLQRLTPKSKSAFEFLQNTAVQLDYMDAKSYDYLNRDFAIIFLLHDPKIEAYIIPSQEDLALVFQHTQGSFRSYWKLPTDLLNEDAGLDATYPTKFRSLT
jgi:hypothetical protein